MGFLNNLRHALASWWGEKQPLWWRGLKPRYRAAILFATAIILYLAMGVFNGGHKAGDATSAQANMAGETPTVRITQLLATQRDATITVRGRTQALHEVDVRAEVEGVVQAIHFDKGQKVKTGDVLCEIKLNDRGAKVAQAQALVAQTGKEYEVAEELYKQGFRSKTQMAQSDAAYAEAKATASTMNIAAANTKIRAPFDGIVDDRYVDVGDYMRVGDKCEMVIAPEPFLAVGAVSEHEVGEIRIGDAASATLVTGETVEGRVRFLADRADQATRTFRIEVELPNPDALLRDGVSADIHVPVRQLKAVKISPGVLVLEDSGAVGVRVVMNGIVRFIPVETISDAPDGMWVAGLPDHVSLITVGQEFVTDGEHVNTVPDKGGSAS